MEIGDVENGNKFYDVPSLLGLGRDPLPDPQFSKLRGPEASVPFALASRRESRARLNSGLAPMVRFLDVFLIHEFEIEIIYWLLLSYFLYIAVQRRRTAPRLLAERTTTHKARFQLRSGPSRPASPRAVCAHRVCTLVCTQQTAWSRGTLSAVTLLAVLPNPNIHMRRLQHLSSRRRPRCY